MSETASLSVETRATLVARAGLWAAWALWLVAVAAGILGLIYGLEEQASGRSIMVQTGLSYAAGTVVTVAFVSVGLLLRVRRPGIVIGWLFLGIGLVGGLANMSWGYVLLGAATGVDPGPVARTDVAWLANAVQASAWLSLAIGLVLVFPDGRLVSRAWRPVLNLVILGSFVLAVCLAVAPGPLQFFPFVENPYAARGMVGDLALVGAAIALVMMAVLAIASAWSFVIRYRRGSVIERQQLKWFGWASSLGIAAGLLEIGMAGPWFGPSPQAADLSWLVFAAAAVTLPMAALVAIMRYRLYDIDRLIGRTFVYGALTAILAGLYAASIRLFTSMFVGITRESSDTALVLTTLVLATTFTPIKQRLETIAAKRLRDPSAVAAAATATAGGAAASADWAVLEGRMEEIARRVSREVLAGQLGRSETEPDESAKPTN